MTQFNRWSPEYILKWYFGQEKRWLDHRGNWHLIREMNKEHASNCVSFLDRVEGDVLEHVDIGTAYIDDTPLYEALTDRASE